ncbi:MAG: Gmad2 immunoglobulin-like domain-containing protein [Patescibacteria group bacterium]|nr:Gmad2 immunoglobulin-like domain-containing protein [Patescibacteria group bacterium]
MANNLSKNSNYIPVALALIIVVVIGIILILVFWDGDNQNNNPPVNGGNTTTTGNGNNTTTGNNGGNGNTEPDMLDYTSQDYSFSLEYPENWLKNETGASVQEPKINFYKNISSSAVLPLDHFSNENHVSIFPLGIGTEGLVGVSRDVDFNVGFILSGDSKMFVLEDGTPYAAYLIPQNPPPGWNESGFIWIRAKINNLETTCYVDGEVVDEQDCNPLMGDTRIERSGRIDQNIWNEEKEIVSTFDFLESEAVGELIRLNEPQENNVVTSPLDIQGRARGQWYFEGIFNIVLTDWDGEIITETNAEADGNWMTEEFVPFRAEMQFESPYQSGDPEYMRNGSLILQKANPSGLPENAGALEIPVKFN